ncbi:hypothetical protein [Chlorogloeopsis fritschii]|uniref:hypothetical protein n=1 Tax=Chlorogloeopsis fritschii TaxID=1124 RepID=UPI0003093B52|nr:hypothetical protein [Chlorogloeopsis fritschii]
MRPCALPTCSTWRRVKRVECDCRAGFADDFSAQTDHLSSKPARTYTGKNYIRDF